MPNYSILIMSSLPTHNKSRHQTKRSCPEKLKLMPVCKKYGEQSHYPLEQSRRCRWSLGKKSLKRNVLSHEQKREAVMDGECGEVGGELM